MIESILNDAVRHSREMLKAKSGNKYYFDNAPLKEKGTYKEFLYGNEMQKHKYNEFNKMRNFIDVFRKKEHNIEKNDKFKNDKFKNDIYRSMYENIMHGSEINEQSIKKRNEIKSKLHEQEKHERLYKRNEIEREADTYKALYNYTLKNKDNFLSGNCPDYCNCAFHYLIHNCLDNILKFFNSGLENPDHVYIQIVGAVGVHDHVFITIGSFNHNMFKPILGRLYHNLPKELWVCDPWANIVCPAEKYNDLWKSKMDKWHYMGKCIVLAEEDPIPNRKVIPPSAKCHSPLKKNTYLTIQNSMKKVFNLAVISPDKNVKIMAL
ncbi:hypothetical protein [Xenorhabdus eapokensis]|uniref:Uncharacterized protein n=1 Tax=Xenorhabdus eapokensis TaxID=1873482 RepID=A0A1Q5TX87_9GAMM|nr:hypothetical protein [Xenorhabdus eapokensis]OKP04844.1 hypothetical protein Xedl_00744 [Xenorhabdus eapokensis]OKP05213.1 hypothetical protein Xedl_00436 [Xenorhabdus eapokensis]